MATKKTVAAQSAARNAAKLPADLPTNWTDGQIVSPDGEEVGLTKQHGYNYLMGQVNAAQQAVNALVEAAESSDAVKYTPQTLTDPQQMQARGNIGAMPQYTIAAVADCNSVSVPGTYRIMSTSKNTPIANPVSGDVLMVLQWDQLTAYQIYFRGTNPTEFYVRGSVVGAISSWNPWQRLASAAELGNYLPLSGGVVQNNLDVVKDLSVGGKTSLKKTTAVGNVAIIEQSSTNGGGGTVSPVYNEKRIKFTESDEVQGNPANLIPVSFAPGAYNTDGATVGQMNTAISGRVLQLGMILVVTNDEIDSKINAAYVTMPNNSTAFAEIQVGVGGLALSGGTWMLQINRADAAYGFVFVSKYGFTTEFGYYRSWYNSAWGPWQIVPLKGYVDNALNGYIPTGGVKNLTGNVYLDGAGGKSFATKYIDGYENGAWSDLVFGWNSGKNVYIGGVAENNRVPKMSELNAKITGGTTDIGVGAALASGTLYVVYE